MTTSDGVNGTVCNAEQYQQSLPSQANPYPSISCLTHGQTTGLTVSIETSFLSLVSVIAVYIWIGWNFRWCKKNARHVYWKLFEGPTDIYMFSLLGFDIIQAIGGILNIRWAHSGIVTSGPYCTTQGLIEQFGEVGVALITLMLAIHTFMGLMWGLGLQARGFALGLVALTFIFCSLWVGIGAGIHKNYETPTPFWCWISPQYPGERLAGEYIWLWLALFASLLYLFSFFWLGGRLSVDENKWYKLKLHGVEDAQTRAALGMLLYPIAYSIIILPLSIARWSLFNHEKVPSAATFFAISIFYLSGAVNALLLRIVRPKLLLLTRPETADLDGQPGTELAQGPARVAGLDMGHNPEQTGLKATVTVTAEGGSSTANSTVLSRIDSKVSV